MKQAVEAVNREESSVNQGAREYDVPRSTLARYVTSENIESKRIGSFATVFSKEQEDELVSHILKLEVTCYGITVREIRSLAFQMAVLNGMRHPFNVNSQLAGKDWLRGFRKRHPELSLRTPEATSAARVQAFNKPNVDTFYNVLEEATATGKFTPSRIFNVDETSVVTVQTKKSKVLALRGRRQVGCVTSAERGLLSTACMCMSAAGTFLPPMIIFPRARLTESLKQGAPPDTVFRCNSSGWMTMEDFNAWFEHFLNHTRRTADNPVLLLLDGHVSDSKNLVFLERASANHVTVICLPPHCSHRLQPLDVSFMGPFKSSFSKAVENYLKVNAGKVVTLNEISGLLGKAFSETCRAPIAVNGFRKTGIVPFNRFIFKDIDFAPSEVTNVLTDDEPPFHGFEIHELNLPYA